MIPHRMLKTEVCGTGTRQRVTACRKRLRGSRILHRPHASNHPQDIFAEADICADSRDFTDGYPAMRESSVHTGQAASMPQNKAEQRDLTMVGEEVGIT